MLEPFDGLAQKPSVQNLPLLGNVGVLLLGCTTMSAHTKEKCAAAKRRWRRSTTANESVGRSRSR